MGDCTPRIVFFSSRRRHTRYLRDWSSDVCSSDLESNTEVGYGSPCTIGVNSPKSLITSEVPSGLSVSKGLSGYLGSFGSTPFSSLTISINLTFLLYPITFPSYVYTPSKFRYFFSLLHVTLTCLVELSSIVAVIYFGSINSDFLLTTTFILFINLIAILSLF